MLTRQAPPGRGAGVGGVASGFELHQEPRTAPGRYRACYRTHATGGARGREPCGQGVGNKLAEVERKRSGYLDLAAEGLMDRDELRTKLAALEETRETAQRELAALRGRTERLQEFEQDAEAILEVYTKLASDALDVLTPEKRQRFYRVLGLRVTAWSARPPRSMACSS
jgi:hypothetical protein